MGDSVHYLVNSADIILHTESFNNKDTAVNTQCMNLIQCTFINNEEKYKLVYFYQLLSKRRKLKILWQLLSW